MPATVTEIRSKVTSGRKILEPPKIEQNAVAVNLKFHKPGSRRHVRSLDAIETVVDKDQLSLSKKIIDCPEYRAICAFDRQAAQWMRRETLRSFLRGSTYLIPLSKLDSVDAKLGKWEKQRPPLVEAFLDVYDQRKEEQRKKLDPKGDGSGMFEESDYPPISRVRESFYMDVQYMTFGLPDNLRTFNSVIYAREAERITKRWNEALEQIKAMLRFHVSELIKNCVAKLQPGEDGKERIFKAGALDKMKEFIDMFDAKNSVANDEELEVLVGNLKNMLSNAGVTNLPDNERLSEKLKSDLKTGFEAVATKAEKLVIAKPGRMILLDGEEGD